MTENYVIYVYDSGLTNQKPTINNDLRVVHSSVASNAFEKKNIVLFSLTEVLGDDIIIMLREI